MKNLSKIMLWMAVLPLLFVMSCKDDDPAPAPADDNFTKLSEYLVSQNLDIDDVVSSWIAARPTNEDGSPKTDAEVNTWAEGFHVMDIRSADKFASGHLNGAVNSSLGTIVQDAQAANPTKPILVVCYTGQSAAHAVVALRLSGYPDAKTLKFGMSGWLASEAGSWEANSGDNGNIAIGHSNWVVAPGLTEASQTFANPTFEVSSTDPAEMLAERVAVLTSGFNGVPSSDVLNSPDNYFINNYWGAGDVTDYGNISGAYRINPLTLEGGQINSLDPSKTVVTYCWTGQTSSMVTAYLKVLGYDSKSLKFGVNSMIYDNLTGHKFVTPTHDYPVVVD